MGSKFTRGEVWYADLGETVGHEQAGHRPTLIVSTNRFHQGSGNLLVVVPLTSSMRVHPMRITVKPPEAGLKVDCQIQTDQVRTISRQRLGRRVGKVKDLTLALVEHRLRELLELY